MIKRNNKKGFTIVELVIVIAVIAILAAVLIPTFAGIIRKANISADTQLAKNLNNALAADEAIDGKPENFSDVLTVFRENGYIVANLNPTAAGCYFVWESETNQIILVDSKKDYKVIYASKELEDETPGETWYFAVSSTEEVATLKGLFAGINVLYTPKTVADLNAALDKVYKEGGKQNLVISEDLVLSNKQFLLKNADGEVALDLGGNTVTTTTGIAFTVTGVSEEKRFSQLTAAAGVLNVGNGNIISDTKSSFAISAIENGTVNVENVTVDNIAEAGVALRVLGSGATMNVSDTTVLVSKAGGIEVGMGTAVFDNVTITTTDAPEEGKTFSAMCVAASRGGKLVINSGNYTAKGTAKGVVAFYPTSGTVEIKGGTFVSQNKNENIFYLHESNTKAATHTIEISGGTFNEVPFDEVTNWASLFGNPDKELDTFVSEIKVDTTSKPGTTILTVVYSK